MARTSFTLVMLGITAAVTLLLGVVGIYGGVAYGVPGHVPAARVDPVDALRAE